MRLIDADALLKQFAEVAQKASEDARYTGNKSSELTWDMAVKHIKNAPTVDAVTICRCQDCDMWNEEDFSGKKSLGNYRCACDEWSNMEDGRRVYTGPDEFCSRGNRKGGDE